MKAIRPQSGPQERFMSCSADMVLYGGARGGGKAGRCPDRRSPDYREEDETKVLTPKGFKLLGDIKVGDSVCNPDGTVAKVIGVFDMGLKQFYRVTLADGSSVEASEDHLWAYSVSGARKRRKKAAPIVPDGLRPEDEWNLRYMQRCSVGTTKELKRLVDRGDDDYAQRKGHVRRVLLPLTSPVCLTGLKGKWPKFPPYTLGALLGDGHLGSSGVFISSNDPEILDNIRQELAETLPHLRLVRINGDDRCPSFRISGSIGCRNNPPPAQSLLRRDGLLDKLSQDKFIPQWIKLSPPDVRFRFMQGLFDTDGYIDERGHIEFATISHQLALDTQWMLRSLGFKATLSEKKLTTYHHNGEKRNGKQAYRIHARGVAMDRLFSLKRKKERAKSHFNGNDVWPGHRVISVEKTVVDYARCIQVSHPNSLYITDDFIVTHNTYALVLECLRWIKTVPGFGANFFRRTYGEILDQGGPWDTAAKIYPLFGGKSRRGDRLDWVFPPHGNRVEFSYCRYDSDVEKYLGSQMPLIAIDQAEGFSKRQLINLRTSNRTTCGVRPYMRLTANPNPDCFLAELIEWWLDEEGYPDDSKSGVIRYFVLVEDEPIWGDPDLLCKRYNKSSATSFSFIPAFLEDNPELVEKDPGYRGILDNLHPIDYERFAKGNWRVREEAGKVFNENWFEVVDDVPHWGQTVRFWDLAATEREISPKGKNQEPCYTSSVKIRRLKDQYFILDYTEDHLSPAMTDQKIKSLASLDGRGCAIRWEQEGGASGKRDTYSLGKALDGFDAAGVPPQGDKVSRAKFLASAAYQGRVKIHSAMGSDKIKHLLKRLHKFPDDRIKDVVDASAGAYNYLSSLTLWEQPPVRTGSMSSFS